MKYFTGLFFLVLTSFSTALTAQKILWERNYGGSDNEFAEDIQPTSDGGSVVAGYRRFSTPGDVTYLDDYWVVKLDQSGAIEWDRTYRGYLDDHASSIAKTQDGGYMIAGHSESAGLDVPNNYGGWDGLLVGLNTSGEVVTEQNYGGSDDDRIYAVEQTKDLGYIFAGSSRSADIDLQGNLGEEDFWIVKADVGGDIEWGKNYGGSDRDVPASLDQTGNGGYIIAGSTLSGDGNISVNHGSYDSWILRLNPEGGVTWSETYGGTGDDRAKSIQQTEDGGFIVAGYSDSNDQDMPGNNGKADAWILKLDPEGEIEWEKNYGGSETDVAESIEQTFDGGFIVAGQSESDDMDVSGNHGDRDIWIIKIDSIGNLQWEKNYGGSQYDEVRAIKQTGNGTYVVGGFSESEDFDISGNLGGYDFWVLNICNQTRVEIDETFCGSYTVPSGDETYTSPGTYTDTIPNHMGCDSIITIHLTNEDYVDTEVYVEGNILQAAQLGAFYQWGRCTESGFDPIVAANEQVYTATESGEYAVVVMLDGCSDTSQCHTVNLATEITENPLPLVNIYPNPADNELTVYLGEEYQTSDIVISNLYGQEVLHKVVHARRPEITLPLEIPAGYYIVTVRQDGVQRSFKFQKLSEGAR